jgi:UTP--glucose-1-phosphate uridylyltransferase
VLLGDVLVPGHDMLPPMLAVSREHAGASVIAVTRVPREQTSRFGIIEGQPLATHEGRELWHITGLVEKPSPEEAPSDLAIFGRYLLTPAIMGVLSQTAPGAGGELQLTDALAALLEHEQMYALVFDAAECFDVGTIEDWLSTNLRLAQRDSLLATRMPYTI